MDCPVLHVAATAFRLKVKSKHRNVHNFKPSAAVSFNLCAQTSHLYTCYFQWRRCGTRSRNSSCRTLSECSVIRKSKSYGQRLLTLSFCPVAVHIMWYGIVHTEKEWNTTLISAASSGWSVRSASTLLLAVSTATCECFFLLFKFCHFSCSLGAVPEKVLESGTLVSLAQFQNRWASIPPLGTAIGYASLVENTARFPKSGVLPLSLTTQEEEVMGRICFVYGCSHRSDREKCSFFRFPTHVVQRGHWERLCR